jgi:hypothetical protein
MAEAVSIPSADLVQEFLTDKGQEVIRRMFTDFRSARMVRKFAGVTDKLILARQDVTASLIKEWNSTLGFTNDAIEVTSVNLEVARMKTELKFIIGDDTLHAYKAYLKGAGLVSDDMGLVEYLLQDPISVQQEELENAMWQGVELNSGIGTRPLIDRINGYREIARLAGVAGDATVVTTGAITSANAVEKVELVYQGADKTMKDRGFMIFCSYNLFENYQLRMLNLHSNADMMLKTITGQGYTLEGMPLRLGAGRSFLVPVPGMGDDDGLVATRPEFLAYGFDYESEWTDWKIQEYGWETWALNKFPVGVQILLQKEGFLIVNEQL